MKHWHWSSRRRRENELEEEIQAHLRMASQERAEHGETPEQARGSAIREFGNVVLVKEVTRDMWGFRWLESSLQDIHYGLRQLRRNPGFTAVAVLTLALGIGATTAVFSVVGTVLLRALPYQSLGELVSISAKSPQGEEGDVSTGDFVDLREQAQAFEGIAAYTPWEFHTLTGIREPDEVWSSAVTPNLFNVLGIRAALGRTFVADETQSVILSYRYWRDHFLSDRTLIGKNVTLDGKPYLVVGVMPADFEFPASDAQMWVPLRFSAADMTNHNYRSLSVITRLKAGVTLKQAQSGADTIAYRLAMEHPETNKSWGLALKQFTGRQLSVNLRLAILVLLGAVVFVQLIVCANVANTLLARSATRLGELAIRAALGAGRLRLIRQLLIESVALAGAASIAGLGVAWAGLHLLVSLVPRFTMTEIHDVEQITINLPVLVFTVAVSVLTGIAVGLLPALRVSRFNLDIALKERGRVSGASPRRSMLQRALVVSEVALALVLLVGAGLMIQSFNRLTAAPIGFKPENVLTVRVPLAKYKYSEGPQSVNFYREVLQRIKAIPGVRNAGMVNNLPLTGFGTTVDFPAPNSPEGPGSVLYVAARSISPGYFQAMGIPLKAGRDFTEVDNEKDAGCVRIINQAMARRYWPDKDPVGTQVPRACRKDAAALIVGVVEDSKQESVDSQAEPEVYMPYGQLPFASYLSTFVIRTASNPSDVASTVREAVWAVDHDQPVIQLRTMKNVILESLWQQHFSASILSAFAVIALFLSAVGIYGVLSYSVSRRTHEIGIRLALGATRGDVLRLVMGEGFFLCIIGVVSGTLASIGLTRLLAGLLYGIRPRDPTTFVTLSLFLVGVGLVAMYLPARRATKVDPLVALRYE